MALSLFLNSILDDEFVTNLAKSADLYKIGSNSVLDPEEIRIGLKVVPRAVMSMLISELSSMAINSSKKIDLPFGPNAWINVNKNAADDYTGSVYSINKLVYDFKNRSIPGLGIILLSTFELYNLEELSKPHEQGADVDKKIQKLIDERMELHSLVHRVVENKMSEREAIHKMMMDRLTEALQKEKKKAEDISDVTKIATDPGNAGANEYMRGMANGLVVADSIANGKHDPKFIDPPLDVKPSDVVKRESGYEKGVGTKPSPSFKEGVSTAGAMVRLGEMGPAKKQAIGRMTENEKIKPNLPKSEDASSKKELPLKKFLDRKKPIKEHHVEIVKSETRNCDSCDQIIFSDNNFSSCLCFGENMGSKIWIKKSDTGIDIKFSKNWTIDNIEMLLAILRSRNA